MRLHCLIAMTILLTQPSVYCGPTPQDCAQCTVIYDEEMNSYFIDVPCPVVSGKDCTCPVPRLYPPPTPPPAQVNCVDSKVTIGDTAPNFLVMEIPRGVDAMGKRTSIRCHIQLPSNALDSFHYRIHTPSFRGRIWIRPATTMSPLASTSCAQSVDVQIPWKKGATHWEYATAALTPQHNPHKFTVTVPVGDGTTTRNWELEIVARPHPAGGKLPDKPMSTTPAPSP
jgi:hypothetical protein